MIQIEDKLEIILLSRLISFVKFKATDDESTFLAGSPAINTLIDKLKPEVDKIWTPRNIQNSNNIQDLPWIKDVILNKLQNIEQWKDLSASIKSETIKTLIYPYEASDEEIEKIIELRDSSKAN